MSSHSPMQGVHAYNQSFFKNALIVLAHPVGFHPSFWGSINPVQRAGHPGAQQGSRRLLRLPRRWQKRLRPSCWTWGRRTHPARSASRTSMHTSSARLQRALQPTIGMVSWRAQVATSTTTTDSTCPPCTLGISCGGAYRARTRRMPL